MDTLEHDLDLEDDLFSLSILDADLVVLVVDGDEGAPLAADLELHAEPDGLPLHHAGEPARVGLAEEPAVLAALGVVDPAAALLELLDGLAGRQLVDRLALVREDRDGDAELQRPLGGRAAEDEGLGRLVPQLAVGREEEVDAVAAVGEEGRDLEGRLEHLGRLDGGDVREAVRPGAVIGDVMHDRVFPVRGGGVKERNGLLRLDGGGTTPRSRGLSRSRDDVKVVLGLRLRPGVGVLELQGVVGDVGREGALEHAHHLARHLLLVGDALREAVAGAGEALDEGVADVPADAEGEEADGALGLPHVVADEAEEPLLAPDLAVRQQKHLEVEVDVAAPEGLLDGLADLGAAKVGREGVDVPHGGLERVLVCSEPKLQMLNMAPTGRDLRNTRSASRRSVILAPCIEPERSQMKTTSGLVVAGILNRGTSVAMRACWCGMVGCVSRTATGFDVFVAMTWTIKSLSSRAVPSESVADASWRDGAASALVVEVEPTETAMGCEGDWIDLMTLPAGTSASTTMVMPSWAADTLAGLSSRVPGYAP
ncbi:hypothetical protein ColKHC_01934 [Colletotrichum higginsianum]|nr:hypothetical protein ColKHC_01934 [Colletotrichum higginsianum]